MDQPAHLVIAVLTYRRPEDIATALPLLASQAASVPEPVRVLVIDNDPDGGARETVAAAAADAPCRIDYVHEPRPGIAAARNRALREAGDDRFLVFIDDDEVPTARWLADLLETYRRYGHPAAVVGPVVSEYSVAPDAWVAAGDFFRRRRLPTGTPVDVAATNNLFLDLAQPALKGLRFDERFGISGGSDNLFTRELAARGGRMVWCDEAVVVDRVPASRVTRRWVLQRALRSGNTHSRVTLELARERSHNFMARGKLLRIGGIRLAGGLLRLAAGLALRSLPHQAKGLRTAARGAGMVSGAFGYVYYEYRRKPRKPLR